MVDVVTRIESSAAGRESTDGKIDTMAHEKETYGRLTPPIKRRNSKPAARAGDDQLPRRTSTGRRHQGRLHSLTARNEVEFEAVWGITKEQENVLLDQYRKNIERATGKPLHPRFNKNYLQRFLRARQHDLNKAEKMFLDHLAWRKDFGADTILEDFVYNERDSFLALYPQGYHKVDKSGRPIYVQHLGQINLKALKNVTTEERMIKYHVQEYERALKYIFPACSKVRGHYISQTLAILDLKGVGLRHLNGDVKRILSTITTIDQNNYPETLGKTLIINAPAVFRAIWAIVKPMLDPRTQAKIEVCPADYMKVLTKWIDIENIPSYLGGKSNGSLIDDVGPWNDESIIQEIDNEIAESLESVTADQDARSDIFSSTNNHDVGKVDALEGEEIFQDAVPRRASSVSTLASLCTWIARHKRDHIATTQNIDLYFFLACRYVCG